MVLRIPKISVSTIFAIIPILYFNSCTFEFIKHYSFVLPAVVACVLLWFGVLLKEGAAIHIHDKLPMLGYVLILGVFFLLGGQNRVPVLLTELTNTIYLLFFMFVFTIYSDERYENDRWFILVVCLADTILSCGYSIYRLIDNPYISRLLSTGSYHTTDEAMAARGIVSFGVIYGLALILLVVFFLITQKEKYRLFNIVLFVLFATVLFLAQFLIAILLVGIGIVWMLFVNNRDNGENNPTRLFIMVIIAIVCLVSLPLLIRVIVDSDIFGYEINARLEEMLTLFKGGNLEGTDLSVRFVQYVTSISGFIFSFGLGKIAVNSVEVGSHSQWLDGLGNYGLLYILFIVGLFVFRRFVLQRLPNKKAQQLYKLVFGIYTVMSLANTSMWAPITLSLCVIVPFLCLDKAVE